MGNPAIIEERAERIVAAAQAVLDAWEQDEDGFDEVYGHGGVCQDVASAIASEALSDVETWETYTEMEGGHVYLLANLDEGVFSVDIPAAVYETGAGYVWRKREGVTLGKDDIVAFRLSGPVSDAEFRRTWTDDHGPGFEP